MWQKVLRLGGAPKCQICDKTAYPQEQVTYNKQVFHEGCFKCSQCRSALSVSSVSQLGNEYFCQTCFQKLPAGKKVAAAKQRSSFSLLFSRSPDTPTAATATTPTAASTPSQSASSATGVGGSGSAICNNCGAIVQVEAVVLLSGTKDAEDNKLLQEYVAKFLQDAPVEVKSASQWQKISAYLTSAPSSSSSSSTPTAVTAASHSSFLSTLLASSSTSTSTSTSTSSTSSSSTSSTSSSSISSTSTSTSPTSTSTSTSTTSTSTTSTSTTSTSTTSTSTTSTSTTSTSSSTSTPSTTSIPKIPAYAPLSKSTSSPEQMPSLLPAKTESGVKTLKKSESWYEGADEDDVEVTPSEMAGASASSAPLSSLLDSYGDGKESLDELPSLPVVAPRRSQMGGSAVRSLGPVLGSSRDRRTGLRSAVPRGRSVSPRRADDFAFSDSSTGADGLGALGGHTQQPQRERGRRRAPSIVEYAMGRRPSGAKSGEEDDDAARMARMETVEKFLEAIQLMSAELEPHKAADRVIEETCKLLMCERASLFYVDHDTDELILTVAKGAKNIRLPKSKGIAGYVATNSQIQNIKDAYADERFDSSFDKQSGFVTRNILCAPILDNEEGEVIAVLQCINKMLVPNFTAEDEILIQNVAAHSAIVLRNSQLYLSATRAEQKVNSLLELVQMLHSQPNITSLIFTLSARAHQLVNADRCTLYLVDKTRTPPALVVMQGEVDIRLPLSKGIAGAVATSGEIVNIPDCYKDVRFNKQIDIKTGYRTKSMLCMPIYSDDTKKEVIGVLQLLNKMDESQFGPADESILEVLLAIAGPIIKNSFFFKKEKQAETTGVGFKSSNMAQEEHPGRRGRQSPAGTPRHKEKLTNPFGSIAE